MLDKCKNGVSKMFRFLQNKAYSVKTAKLKTLFQLSKVLRNTNRNFSLKEDLNFERKEILQIFQNHTKFESICLFSFDIFLCIVSKQKTC